MLGGEILNYFRNLQEMSYNNYLDTDAAWNCVCEFNNPTCVVVKHTNPCGVASVGPNQGLLEAYRLAVRADPVSAFGGIVAFNVEVDEVNISCFHLSRFMPLLLFARVIERSLLFPRHLQGRFGSFVVPQMVRLACFMRSW